MARSKTIPYQTIEWFVPVEIEIEHRGSPVDERDSFK